MSLAILENLPEAIMRLPQMRIEGMKPILPVLQAIDHFDGGRLAQAALPDIDELHQQGKMGARLGFGRLGAGAVAKFPRSIERLAPANAAG